MLNSRPISETTTRALLLVYALPPFVFMVLFAEWTMILMFSLLSFFGFREYLRLVFEQAKGWRSFWFYPVPVILMYLPMTGLVPGFPVQLSWYVLVLWIVTWGLLSPEQSWSRITTAGIGIFYCIVLPSFWVKAGVEGSRIGVVVFALVIWCSDIGAYLIGSRWGKHRFIPSISPRKTLEGLAGGILASSLAGALFVFFLSEQRSAWEGWGIGAMLGLLAFLGDIFESSLKRRAGVKDSGTIFPGHGGVLDRFDAFLLAGPAVYFLALYWGGI